jgi:hypothetical protein
MVNDMLGFAAEQLVDDPSEQQRACLGSVLLERANRFSEMGQHSQAEDMARQALTIAREFGDKQLAAWCLCQLACVVRDPEKAKRYCEEGLSICAELGDKRGQANAHQFLALISMVRGNRSAGEIREHLSLSLALSREIGDRTITAWALLAWASYYYDQAQIAEAQQSRQESLTIFRELDNRRGLALALTETAAIAMDDGDLETATCLMNESLAINREVGEPSYLGWALARAGILAEINGDDAEAHRLAQEAFANTEHNYSLDSVNNYLVQQFLAWTYCVRGEFTIAAAHLASCLQGMRERRETANLVYSLPAIIWVLAARGQPERAIELLGLAVHTHAEAIQRWDVRRRWRLLRADLEAQLGSEVYQAALERGKSLDLEAAAAALIAELAD